MPVIASISPKGGAGKTTLTANLASILSTESPEGERYLAIDTDPQNALRFHHRMPANHVDGIATATLNRSKIAQTIYSGPHGVDCLPYGLANESQRQAFESVLSERVNWFAQTLKKLKRSSVIIDTPPGPSVYMRQALSVADVVLVVLLADAASFATFDAIERYFDDYCPPDRARPVVHYVVNQFDSSKMLNRDVFTLMQQRLPAQSLLWRIHYDSAVEEALACSLPLHKYQPQSVATGDLMGVAKWLKTNFQ